MVSCCSKTILSTYNLNMKCNTKIFEIQFLTFDNAIKGPPALASSVMNLITELTISRLCPESTLFLTLLLNGIVKSRNYITNLLN